MISKALAHLAVLIVLATLLPSHVSPIPLAGAQTSRYTVTMIPAFNAQAVNDQGQVVRSDIHQISPGNFLDSVWLWDRGQVTAFDRMDSVSSINNKGQIVGDMVLSYQHAVL